MRALVRDHDWAATALGDAAGWPPELRVAVDLMLDARHPALVGWSTPASSAMPVLFNDAYARLLGDGYPRALGQPLSSILPAAWPRLAPLVGSALAGAPAWLDDVLLVPANA